jgi:hypothetical protein
MTLKVAYFAPTIMALDELTPAVFSKVFNLAELLHSHSELNDAGDPKISVRGGQQIQVYPNNLGLDITWLIKILEDYCRGYMELVTTQSGAEELKMCKPVITSIWTIRQSEGHYQEMHSHPAGNISGNMYIQVPEFKEGSNPSDGQILFRLPVTKDITKFIMNDTWKYTPQASTIVLFPSHIAHTVYPWKGSGYRTVMAFDAVLRPKDE